MNSLISLLWQYEILGFPIAPTFLKNKQSPSRQYFYSQKQERVLRKKQAGNMSTIQNMLMKQKQKQTQYMQIQNKYKQNNKQANQKQMKNNQRCRLIQFLKIIRNQRQKTIQLKFCSGIQTLTDLKQDNFQGQFTIIEQNSYQLCFVSYTINKKVKQKGEIQVEYLACQQPQISHSNKQYHLSKSKIQNFVNKFIISLEKSLRNKIIGLGSKKTQTQVEVVNCQIIVAVNSQRGNWIDQQKQLYNYLLVDAVRLQFSQPIQNILQIKYTPIQQSLSKTDNQHGKIKQQTIYEQYQQGERIKAKMENSQKSQQNNSNVCSCCSTNLIQFGNKKGQQQIKQITNKQMKLLYKAQGKSIRALSQEYYTVCWDCYMLADQQTD